MFREIHFVGAEAARMGRVTFSMERGGKRYALTYMFGGV